MKNISKLGSAIALLVAVCLAGCSPKQPSLFSAIKDNDTASQLRQFVAEKQAQAKAATNSLPSEMDAFFSSAQRGDWLAASNSFSELCALNGQYGSGSHAKSKLGKAIENLLTGIQEKLGHRAATGHAFAQFNPTAWAATKEVFGALEAASLGDEKYDAAFARDIIQSIPPGSIYFGGTDPGRFLVTALCKSHRAGDPFFTLTQNALADGSYLEYLRGMYGNRLYIPTADDSQKCFEDYTKDVAERAAKSLLKPGEDVKTSAGRVQVSGQVAVMQINALLVKIIFDNNPKPDFYIEESFPLDWMYPQLEPHGLIFKLNRQPAAKLSDETIQHDHDYWAKYVQPMIGDWLKDGTSVAEVAAFVEKTFGRHDFSGFKGDPRFSENTYSHKMFSKLRSSIAGVYAWRVSHAADAEDKERMVREADFAFRQAWALCPYSPEAVFRYVNFLLEQKRADDAVLVAETALQMPALKGESGAQVRTLVGQIKKFQKVD